MANNIFASKAHAGTALQTVLFSAIPAISAASIARIYLVGNPYKSFTPGNPINAITGFVAGQGYLINPKQDLDLSGFITPPLPATSDNAIEWEEGSGGGPLQNETN